VCCIDELDKMSCDPYALLEAMEQQQISIAKAGVVTKVYLHHYHHCNHHFFHHRIITTSTKPRPRASSNTLHNTFATLSQDVYPHRRARRR
jgi:hypothetical protein